MDLTGYRQRIRTLARKRDGQAIYNATVEHATIIVEHLFSNAGESVDILTGSLNPRVYGRDRVIEEAQLFLLTSRENRIRIILEEDLEDVRMMHPLLVALRPYKNVDVKYASDDIRRHYDFHLIVTGNDHYRFEPDKSSPAAVAAFGDPAGGRNLRSVYSTIWSRCPRELTRPRSMAPISET